MTEVRRPWVGSIITVLVASVFLVGCPKRPEIAETAPKPIGPQGMMAMPAPQPPTVSAVPPIVPAREETSPPEVTARLDEAEAGSEAEVQEAETPESGGQAYQDPVTPPVQESGATESGVGPGAKVREGEVSPTTEGPAMEAGVQPGAGAPEGEVKPGASAAGKGAEAGVEEPELKPEAFVRAPEALAAPEAPGSSTPGKGAEPPAGTETQVKGAEVGPVPDVASSTAGESSAAGESPPAPAEPVVPAPVPSPPPPAPAAVADAPKALELTVKDIFFDFDQASIRDDSRKVLAENIAWLRANPATKVGVEGHCDERGSSEYNLALGERRARVTRDYLAAAGIETSRISTISFGKERPFVLGHDESAWKWNRRAHFVVTTK